MTVLNAEYHHEHKNPVLGCSNNRLRFEILARSFLETGLSNEKSKCSYTSTRRIEDTQTCGFLFPSYSHYCYSNPLSALF